MTAPSQITKAAIEAGLKHGTASEDEIRRRVARLIAKSMCDGMYDAAEVVERSWENYLPLAATVISIAREARA